MKVAIIGTRGIPNQYGGFEQFAEKAALLLLQKGYAVTVYSSSLHPYKEKEWRGVRIVTCKDPENRIGTAGQFIYDLRCILHSRGEQYDIILQLGYTSSSIWNFLLPKKPVLITNMDGLEWKRSKYSRPVQRFLKTAERLAVKHSDELIADSKGIAAYLQKKYNAPSHYIAYGADAVEAPPLQLLDTYGLKAADYNLAIARFEPENNLEMIIKGHLSYPDQALVLVGNHDTAFGKYLKATYTQANIVFAGPVYNEPVLNALRFYSRLYFHGHSVGGTNPSLLEAMGCGCLIAAHRNGFNEGVLGDEAFYFSSADDIARLLGRHIQKGDHAAWTARNLLKIKHEFSWPQIAEQLDHLFKTARKKHA